MEQMLCWIQPEHSKLVRTLTACFYAKMSKNALRSQGIDPLEAKARIDSLSDAEIVRLADQIDKLPAGGAYQIIPAWVAILILVAVALLIYLFISAVTPPTEVEKKSE